MVKVSVIMPVYNTEKYLDESLKSILNQTLTDLEIICINDGSTDKSLSILKFYEKLDKRIKIISQENHGQGHARNYGLDIAKGDYIYFMDSDDILELDALEKSYKLCVDKSLDFVMFKMINFNEKTNKFYKTNYYEMPRLDKFLDKDIVFSPDELGDVIFNIAVSPVNKLYDASFIKRVNVKFPENLIFEDNVFFWEFIFETKRIYFLKEYLYIRRVHADSTTSGGSKRLVDAIKINNMIFDIFKSYNLFDKFSRKLYNKKMRSLTNRLEQINNDDKIYFYNQIKKDFKTMDNPEKFTKLLSQKNKNFYNSIMTSDNYNQFLLLMSIAELNQENKKLKNQLTKINSVNNQILNSSGWKLTKALRRN